jgi:hypothetical protein
LYWKSLKLKTEQNYFGVAGCLSGWVGEWLAEFLLPILRTTVKNLLKQILTILNCFIFFAGVESGKQNIGELQQTNVNVCYDHIRISKYIFLHCEDVIKI